MQNSINYVTIIWQHTPFKKLTGNKNKIELHGSHRCIQHIEVNYKKRGAACGAHHIFVQRTIQTLETWLGMETLDQMLVSSWYNVHSLVPPSYVQLPENRPSKVVSSLHKAIPVIDFGGHDRVDTTKQILEASEEYGFFQVTKYNFLLSYLYLYSSLNLSLTKCSWSYSISPWHTIEY